MSIEDAFIFIVADVSFWGALVLAHLNFISRRTRRIEERLNRNG